MNYNSFHRLLKNKYALSTVVTTLIILVISVLLASVVTYFAINVVSTRVQEESLTLMKQHIWLNSTATPGSMAYSAASLMVINTGGRDVVIQKLAVRGQSVAWDSNSSDNKQLVLYTTTNNPVAEDMPYVPNFNSSTTGGNSVSFGQTTYDFTVATTSLTLKSGTTMLMYIINPDSITINDVGLTVSVTLYTAQAMYYVETNVQTTEG